MSAPPPLFERPRGDRGSLDASGARPRAPRPDEAPSSDLAHTRGVALAAVLGAAVTLALAVRAASPTSPGPLARPHARAGLACEACHGPSAERSRPVPDAACARCHGSHRSTRPGHRRLADAGALGCARCHAVHHDEQGVAFTPGERPLRFGTGLERAAAPSAFRPAREVTVAVVAVERCAACHDPGAADDPLRRCLAPSDASLGRRAPTLCFDEHQPALATSPRDHERAACAAQHGPERAFAWDAARAVLAEAPTPRAPVPLLAPPLSWIGAGLVVAALALAGSRARRRPSPPAPSPPPRATARLPVIDAQTCLGCHACVDACPFDALAVERYVAVLARPDACCGAGLCEARCPNGSLTLGEASPHAAAPRLDDALGSLDVPGVHLAGDVTRVPLIKNAIHQGVRAVDAIAAALGEAPRRAGELDLVVVGAGPAGLAAALRAKELGLAFEVVEQATVAESIKSFPRSKLVFDQPLELPTVGPLWLAEATKEELLARWTSVLRRADLPLREGARMTAVRRAADGGLLVETATADGATPTTRRARRVLLAIGRRGTPRRLPVPIPDAALGGVHYHLADARSHAGQAVVVVGLGDAAMEAAIALSFQPGTRVALVARGEGFRRGRARTIAEVRRLRDAGRLRVLFGAEVASVAPGRVTVRTPDGPVDLEADALVVLIGARTPVDTLAAAGVVVARPTDPAATSSVEPRARPEAGPTEPPERPR